MGALSSNHNETIASTFDQDRDGFVVSGGAGMLIIESEEHAAKRNADILL